MFVLGGWAQRVLRPSSAPPVFLAEEERDVAEGVKQSGAGDRTQHAAGPTLTGPMAPLITQRTEWTVNSEYQWKMH